MIRVLVCLLLASSPGRALSYVSCDFFVHGVPQEVEICTDAPPAPNRGFLVLFDGRACDDDAWSRARLDVLTEYVVDPDLSPSAAARQACDGRTPAPSDIRIDSLRFQVCEATGSRGLRDIRFVAIVWPPGDEADGLRQLSFDIYARRYELPAYRQRLRRLAGELHLDYALYDKMEHAMARPRRP